jgi:outer membrane receptor protein involved in Fe transport
MIRPRFGAAGRKPAVDPRLRPAQQFPLRGVNVLIDGFIYGQADGFSDFESLELLTTKRIEIYKGANALALGGYTLGGAINLVSKTGYDAGLVRSAARPARSASSRTTSAPPGLRPCRHLRGVRRYRARRLSRPQ